MVKIKKFYGYTLIEAVSCLIILSILFAITALSIKDVFADSSVARFKKANATLDSTVTFLVNEKNIYGDSSGFKNIETVNFDTGEILGQEKEEKFRDAFKYSVNTIKDNIDCEIYKGTSKDGCFKTEDGIVWGIPDTDFDKTNTMKIKDYNGDNITIVPVTVYFDYKKNSDIKTGAIVAGITYNAKIIFLKGAQTDIDCTSVNAKEYPQCQIDSYIKAVTIKRQI